MVTKKKLKRISQKQLDERIQEHFLFLKWDKTKKADLSFIDFEWVRLDWVNLKWANFEWSDLSKIDEEWEAPLYSGFDAQPEVYGGIINSNFEDVNFVNANLSWISFKWVKLSWAILIWAKISPKQFDETQKNEAIFTEADLLKRWWKQKEIIEEQAEVIEKKEEVLEQIWEDYTLRLKKWFLESLRVFKDEELIWLKVAMFMFIVLLISSFFPVLFSIGIKYTSYIALFFLFMTISLSMVIIDAVTSESKEIKEEVKIDGFFQKWGKRLFFIPLAIGLYKVPDMFQVNLWWGEFDYQKLLPFLPFDLICAIFLYFCIAQYSKAKMLRIEFQNKLAIIDGYMGLTAQLGTGPERRIDMFLPNISDVLFTKAFSKWEKESNLPVDEILRIVELVNKKAN